MNLMKSNDSTWQDPLTELKHEFFETRKSYGFRLAFKAMQDYQKTQPFIQSIKNEVAESIITSLESLKRCKLINYMYLYQIFRNYLIEQLKQFRCNCARNYFQGMMSSLHLDDNVNYMMCNKNQLLF